MNDKANWCNDKEEFFDFRNDLTLLTRGERQNIIETARTYWNLLRDNDALPADAENDSLPMDSGKRK